MHALRLFALCFSGALGACVARPIAEDPATVASTRRATRKEARPAADPAADLAADATPTQFTLPTWATLVNVHTGEMMALSPDDPSSHAFDHLLRDRTTGAAAPLDLRLLELLRQLGRRHPGARIELVSGYRSPKLNERLRKKGHRVASNSQHVLGRAVDFRVSGLTPRELKEELLALEWTGGIGRYDGSGDRFVHADVGPQREWTGGAQ